MGAQSEKFIAGSTTTWHDYITAAGQLVAEHFNTGGTISVLYAVDDHIYSVSSVTNASASVTERDSYDAWGRRRNTNGTDNATCSLTSAVGRGYTGHEMMDAVCLVNANARIYDPTIGRFMSADPTVPDGFDGQAFDRYAYVTNNPLRYTDPSGYDGKDTADKTVKKNWNDKNQCSGGDCTGTLLGVLDTWDNISVIGGQWQNWKITSQGYDANRHLIGSSTYYDSIWVPGGPADLAFGSAPNGTNGATGAWGGGATGSWGNSSGFGGLLRLPDYVAANINIAIPNPWTGTVVGWSGTVSLDRYGDWYYSPFGVGVGKSATALSGSITVNWMDQTTTPSQALLQNMLSANGFNISAGYWGGVSESYTPGAGYATGVGFVSPQVGVSYNYSLYGRNVGGGW